MPAASSTATLAGVTDAETEVDRMTRQSLAMSVRSLAGSIAVARNPSDLFRLSRRLAHLAPCLQATACADARAIIDAEQAAQRDYERSLDANR
jgi:hypothetical protein